MTQKYSGSSRRRDRLPKEIRNYRFRKQFRGRHAPVLGAAVIAVLILLFISLRGTTAPSLEPVTYDTGRELLKTHELYDVRDLEIPVIYHNEPWIEPGLNVEPGWIVEYEIDGSCFSWLALAVAYYSRDCCAPTTPMTFGPPGVHMPGRGKYPSRDYPDGFPFAAVKGKGRWYQRGAPLRGPSGFLRVTHPGPLRFFVNFNFSDELTWTAGRIPATGLKTSNKGGYTVSVRLYKPRH